VQGAVDRAAALAAVRELDFTCEVIDDAPAAKPPAPAPAPAPSADAGARRVFLIGRAGQPFEPLRSAGLPAAVAVLARRFGEQRRARARARAPRRPRLALLAVAS
jgi:hypothetical protein